MSDQDILKENKRLQLLVEDLKRDNVALSQTVQLSMEQAEHALDMHWRMIEQARAMIQEEHEKHCVKCSKHTAISAVSEQGEVAFSMVLREEDQWGTN